MGKTMKQLQIVAPGRVEWRDVPIPEPGPGQVLVKILGVTTCPHWDLHLMDGVSMFPGGTIDYPYTPGQPGHEAVGEIVALGAGVTGLAVGMRVAAWRDQGHHVPGCYAQYNCLKAENAIEVPADLEAEAIASLELAMCVQVCFAPLLTLDTVRGKRFGVSGLGPAGLVAVQMAKAYGAREVIGIDPVEARRKAAAALGVTRVIAPDPTAFAAGRTTPEALDAAMDCTGVKPSIEFLMDRTREAVAVFGVLREDVSFGWRHWPGLALLGARSHSREGAERALELVKRGQLTLRPLVTHTLPFTRYAEGVDLLRRKQAIKVCFRPWAAEA